MELRHGLNPEQAARATSGGAGSPIRPIAGEPSYINVLDALGGWQLVRETSRSLAAPAAASFKHVSPAGAAIAGDLDEVMSELWSPTESTLSPIATAYVRARDADPKSSFGDFVAVSEPVDLTLARLLASVVSDGIVAPAFEAGTVEILAAKKGGRFLVLEADPAFEPPGWEQRDVFGVRLEQESSRSEISNDLVAGGTAHRLDTRAVEDLVLAMIAARHTQSNSVTYTRDGMVLGVGAGQQSRVDCTKIAGAKVDTWWLRRLDQVRSLPFRETTRRQDRINWQIRFIEGDMDATETARFHSALTAPPQPLDPDTRRSWLEGLDEVALASDGYIPFRDNIDQAARHGVRYVADPGGSERSDEVEAACAEHGIIRSATGMRLFRH